MPKYQTVLHAVIEQAPDLAVSSKEKYQRDLDMWIDFAGDNPVGWTREQAQAFYNALLKTMKPQSANRLMSSVSYASRWWAHTANDPSLDFAIVRKAANDDSEPRMSLDAEQARKLLDTTRASSPMDLRDRAMMVLGLETGMRRMSLEGAKFDEIADKPYLRILVPIKGHNRPFSVPLSDTAALAIARWASWIAWTRSPAKTGAIFRRVSSKLDGRGQTRSLPVGTHAISAAMIHKIIAQRSAEAGIGHVHPHIFRHTFVTWRTDAGFTDAQIAAVTGHSLTARSGALGNYKDLMAIGATSRQWSPAWLTEWVSETCR